MNALKLGAMPKEVIEMLELTILMGIHTMVVAPLLLAKLDLKANNIRHTYRGNIVKAGTNTNSCGV